VQLFGEHDEIFDEPQVEPFHRPRLLIAGRKVLDFRARAGHAGERSELARPTLRSHAMPEANTGVAMRPTLTDLASRRLIDAAVATAKAMSVPITVVTVDESGVTKQLLRMDEAPLVSVQTAINKAYTAAAIGMPPDDFFSAIEADGAAVASFGSRPGLALIAGGLPVLDAGTVAGAIGVAGAMTGAEDRQIAEAALEQAFASTPARVPLDAELEGQ
jgi:uncharacterized protein GlcG (DUF336 family)